MTPADYMAIGAVLIGTVETIIALLPIKPNSTVELVIFVLKSLFAPYRR